ncbi:lecithin retinol acyltransferase family protein [Trinickia sp. NRRL B-1857]|uniref:lecithin retinol acyltransferase family protein n=1 Tax=Trinickia sp. NRRL B-1857 TaxID=3162879 RepID=UPI003D2B90E3
MPARSTWVRISSSEREGYSHHGIYAGNGQVIHYGGFHHSIERRPVEVVSLQSFSAGRPIGCSRSPMPCIANECRGTGPIALG